MRSPIRATPIPSHRPKTAVWNGPSEKLLRHFAATGSVPMNEYLVLFRVDEGSPARKVSTYSLTVLAVPAASPFAAFFFSEGISLVN